MDVIHPEIAKAKTLPSNYYTDESLYNSLLEKFSTTWNFVGHVAMLEQSTTIPVLIGNNPMMLTKDESGEFHCLSNVCTHRGMILSEVSTNRRTIKCAYHGRTFNLCGKLKYMPEFEQAENFPSNSDDLPSKKVNNWHGLLFANLQNGESFNSFISAVEDRMNFLNIEDFQFDSKLDKTHHLDSNWMLYVDNYLEGFHIPFVHNELNSVLDYSSYETQLFDNGVLQIGFAKEGEAKFDLPKNHEDYGKSIAAYYWWLFPNLMLNFYPWGLSINLVNPNGYSKTVVKYHGLIADQTKVGLGAGGDVDLVELQDQEIVEACFRGMKSSLYNRGRYSPKMEKGVHHFHRILTNQD